METATEKVFHTISVPREITERKVRNLLCSAFEGGSAYWAMRSENHLRDGLKIEDFSTNSKDKSQGSIAAQMTPNEYWPTRFLVPFVEGCHVTIEDAEEEDEEGNPVKYKIDIDSMKQGLQLMADKHPRHFHNFMEENDDAETGDVFLQLVCMGDIVYG